MPNCCVCNKKLAKTGAKYCPDGHSQFDTRRKSDTKKLNPKKKIASASSGSEESESDDRDKSDTDKDDVVMVSKRAGSPPSKLLGKLSRHFDWLKLLLPRHPPLLQVNKRLSSFRK